MVAGRLNNRIGFVIQARMRSSRLPGKVLLNMPIKGGKPIIQWIVDQLNTTTLNAQTIVATSVEQEDDKIADYCKEKSISYFRGSEENVLSRFIKIRRKYNFDVIVRITGDNPLLDMNLIDKTVHQHIKQKSDYTCTKGLPVGMNIEVISGEAIDELMSKSLSTKDNEHVTRYIVQSDEFNKNLIEYNISPSISNLRLTVDYPSDYTVLSFVLSFYEEEYRSGLELLNYVEKNYQWIFDVNKENIQKKEFKTLNEEVEFAINQLEKIELNQAVDILKKHTV